MASLWELIVHHIWPIYESDYIQKCIDNKDYKKAKLLSNIFRFQDDCIVFNDDKVFDEVFKDIYKCDGLELRNTNIAPPSTCTFLDMTITVY